MSAKPVQVSYGERRLKPIYDLLDNGNYKKAIQEADKVLKKQPSTICAKVLKALALQRLGKETESLELLDLVKQEEPVDDCTLQAMTACYKDLNEFKSICDIYEAACKKEPNNEDLQINLFNSYVRIGDYKTQQITAVSLGKNIPKSQYHFWILMSLILQAVPVDKLCEHFYPALCVFKKPCLGVEKWSRPSSVILQWAERLILKLLQEDSIKSTDEILLAVVVMEIWGNYDKALDILTKFKPLLPFDIFAKKQIDLFIKKRDILAVNHHLQELLLMEPDSWCLIQYYLDSVAQLSALEEGAKSKYHFEQASSFIRKLICENEKTSIRGPYLAQMELYEFMKMKGFDPKEVLEDIDILMLNYTVKFNHLSCCSRDLSPYLPLLVQEKNILHFLSSVREAVGLGDHDMPKNKDQMNFHLVNLELTRMSGVGDFLNSCDSGPSLVSKCISYFLHAHEVLEKSVAIGESRTSDRYILLAIHQLHDLWISTGDSNYIFEAICVAKLGLKMSDSNRQMKLLLVKLYHILGSTVNAHEAYKQLDIKHLQIDSLGYIHLWPTLQSGGIFHASELLSSSMKFYSNNHKDSSEYLIMAYKFKSYMKIPDFINILQSLENSLHHKLVKVENVLVHLIKNNILIKQEIIETELQWDHTKWMSASGLCDLRDMKAVWEMDAVSSSLTQKDVLQSLHQDVALLTLREHLYKILVALIPLSNGELQYGEVISNKNSNDEGNGKKQESNKSILVLRDLKNGLNIILKDIAKLNPSPVLPKTLIYPPVSRLIVYHQYFFFQGILSELKFFLGLVFEKSDSGVIQKELNWICIYLSEFTRKISSLGLLEKKELKTSLTVFIEFTTFSCFIVKALEGIFKQKSSNKKNKKKREAATVVEEVDNAWKEEMILDFKKFLQDSFSNVLRIINDEISSCSFGSNNGCVKSISLENEEFKEELTSLADGLNDEIMKGHILCLKQLLQLIIEKEKLLKS